MTIKNQKPMTATFIRYNRLDRPVTGPEALPTSLKRITKAQYRKLQGELAGARGNAEFQTNKAGRLETLLQRAIKALTSPMENADAKLVIRDYMEELMNGFRPIAMSLEQTSVTLDQWGDHLDITDGKRSLAKKLLKSAGTKLQRALDARSKR